MKTWKKIAVTVAGCTALALGGYFLTRGNKEEPKKEQTAKFTEEDYKKVLEIEESRMNLIKDKEDKNLEMLLNFANDLKRIEGYKRAEEYLNERRFLDAAEEFERNEFYAEAGLLHYNFAELCQRQEQVNRFNNLTAEGYMQGEVIDMLKKEYPGKDIFIIFNIFDQDSPFYMRQPPHSRNLEPPLNIPETISTEEMNEICNEVKSIPSYKKSISLFNKEGMKSYAASIYSQFNRFDEAIKLYQEDYNYPNSALSMIEEAIELYEDKRENKLIEAYEYGMEHQAYEEAAIAMNAMGNSDGFIRTIEDFIFNDGFSADAVYNMPQKIAMGYIEALIKEGQQEKLNILYEVEICWNDSEERINQEGEQYSLELVSCHFPHLTITTYKNLENL